MRIKKPDAGIQEGDLTPMIDMTFQLIAFFMVLINFSQTEQNDKVKLPKSKLAKPPDAVMEFPIVLNLRENGQVIIGGDTVEVNQLRPYLQKEANILRLDNKTPSDATVIIRADRLAKTGKVQQLIEICQKNQFDRFALRAEEDVGNF